MPDSVAAADYYAALQVHPGADQEVIEAAYRQLMKKHHPDVAGRDPRLVAQSHQRATVINRAHSVLRDPVQRRRYDTLRNFGEDVSAPETPPQQRSDSSTSLTWWSARPANTSSSGAAAPAPEESVEDDESMVGTVVRSPFAALAAVYYRLPGPYAWEAGHRQELLTTCLLPPVGVAAFALATGRLAPWVGHSFIQTLLAWGVLALLVLPSWAALPRLLIASVPSLLLMSGNLDVVLRQASVPEWLAWAAVALISLVLSARLYLFAVLPTLGVCWLLTRPG